MTINTQDDEFSTPLNDQLNAERTQPESHLSTDEIRLGSKSSVIRPLAPKPSEVDTAPLASKDCTDSAPARFDLPRPESVPHRQEVLTDRPLAKADPTRETAVLSESNPILKRMIHRSAQGGTASLGAGREVLLVIRGMVERIIMVEGKTYKLGRFEVSTRKDDEIDLSPYGALDRGVSRVHAELSIYNGQIYIKDLTSTNGTFLAGQRLKPNEATLLRKGDELLIGRLPVQVLFR